MLQRTIPIAVLLALSGGAAAIAQDIPAQNTRTQTTSALGGAAAAPAVTDPTVAVPTSAAPSATPDPWERFNRKSFAFSWWLDRIAIRPAAVFYGHAVPHVIRTGLHNAIQNVNSPVVFLNDVLQLHGPAAMQTLGRFAINSTLGLGGLVDVANKGGIPYHTNGFGTTLGRYGVGPGPYLWIPVMGPSDVRDGIGSGVDAVSDPLTWVNYTGRWEVSAAKTVVGGLDTRYDADGQIKAVFSTATDPYASFRSLYLQNRQAQITGGKINVNALPDFGPEPAAANDAGNPGAPPATQGPAGPAAALPQFSAPTTAPPPATTPDASPSSPRP